MRSKGILDMGLLVEPVDVSKYEFIRIPCKERWGLLTQADSPLATQDFVTPGDLTHIPLLIAKRTLVQEELRGWFGRQFESMDIIGTYNLIYNAAIMVKNGVASALLLPLRFGLDGVLYSMPVSDLLTFAICVIVIRYTYQALGFDGTSDLKLCEN